MAHAMAGAVLFVAAATAAAQINGAPPRDPKACAPNNGGHVAPPGAPPPHAPSETTGSGENLSDKLARSHGVLCPPNVDPDIRAPAPNTGKMPVIPPPGGPGGDPDVQPK
jgi:hypothetical protein